MARGRLGLVRGGLGGGRHALVAISNLRDGEA
jgi:hypothetical protein